MNNEKREGYDGYDWATIYMTETQIYESTLKAILDCYSEHLENVKWELEMMGLGDE